MILSPKSASFTLVLKWVIRFGLLVAAFLLAACGPSAEVLPTAIDLNAISTNDAATQQAQSAVAANATATRVALSTLNAPPTLPPTWTPAPLPTEPSAQSSPVPPTVAAATGTLYYIFNGDSIAMLNADGSHEELILAGNAPADLVLSPDDQWLAFTQRVSDTVREVFVMSLKTENIPADQQYKPLQVSCLGFANAVRPAWSADNRILAFAASQAADGALGIYTADASGQCPVGNHQRGLVQTQFKTITGLTWNPNNRQIYFTSGAVYAVDAATGTLYPPLTQATGYGPDSYPVYRPDTSTLYYLKTEHDEQSTLIGDWVARRAQDHGIPTIALVDALPLIKNSTVAQCSVCPQDFPSSAVPSCLDFAESLLALTNCLQRTKYVCHGSARELTIVRAPRRTGKSSPRWKSCRPTHEIGREAVFSPDAEMVAYVDAGAGPNLIQQVWIVNRRGTGRQQLTTHKEGTITNLNWAAG